MASDDPTLFRDYLAAWIPRWMGDVGREFGLRLGLILDGVAQGAIEAVKVRFTRYAPEDALAFLGWERGTERWPGESSPAYAARLQRAHTTASKTDSDKGVVDEFAAVGVTAADVRNNQWDWDGNPGNVVPWWARLWPIITAGLGWSGDGAWDDDASSWDAVSTDVWDIVGAGVDAVAAVRRLVHKMTGSHTLIPAIIVAMSGEVWDFPLGGVWDDGEGDWEEVPVEIAYLEGY